MRLVYRLLKYMHATTMKVSPNASNNILIACFPKTASTFLRNVIAEVGGYSAKELSTGLQRNEQDIYLPKLIDYAFDPVVCHMHMQVRDKNLEYMISSKIKPLVLLRDIFDTTVSLRDHCLKKPSVPMAYIDSTFEDLEESVQYDMIIDMCVPWLISFYVSWYRLRQEEVVPTYWLTYGEMVGNKVQSISDVCRYYGIVTSEDQIRAAIKNIEGDKSKSNFNVGIAGRGKTILNATQQQKIKDKAKYYPDVDFSILGM